MWIFHQQKQVGVLCFCVFPWGDDTNYRARDSPIRDSARVGARMSIGAGMSTVLYPLVN